MPPRRRGNTPPVDPFPPLRRSASASSPSYASIAARSSHPHRDEREQPIWTAEDVDRQDPLDELNAYSGPIDIDPSPPWRSRSRSSLRAEASASSSRPEGAASDGRQEPQPQLEARPSRNVLLTTPSGQHAASRSAALSDGGRNPASGEDNGPSTPSAGSGANRQRHRSPPTPSPTRQGRQAGSSSRLAAIFTLEELLRSSDNRNQEDPTAPRESATRLATRSDSSGVQEPVRQRATQHSNEAAARRARANLQLLEDRRRARELMGDVLNVGAYGMERALPAGAGGGEAADRAEDVERTVLEMLSQHGGSSTLPWFDANGVPSTGRPLNQDRNSNSVNRDRNVQPLDGSGSGPNVTSFLRRRQRNPAPTARIQYRWNPAEGEEEVEEAATHGPEESGLMAPTSNILIDFGADSDEEEDRWGMRTSARTGTEASRGAEYDVDGWTRTGPGGIGGGTGLSRGGNNRRRAAFLQRIGAPPDLVLPGEDGEEEGITFLPPIRGSEATGLEPTNLDLACSTTPVLVRSHGTSRPREDDSTRDSPIYTQERKKRKTNNHGTRAEAEFLHPSRPDYLSYSTLPDSSPIPTAFIPPIIKSHLSLSTYSSSSHGPRPLITFTGCNPKGTDEDATALHTTSSIPIACGVHYYEVLVLDKGLEGFMSVGWTLKGTNSRRLVGWDKGSWGWHGDDGRSFEGQGRGQKFSETWTTGDTVGCGVDFSTGRAFFTKNGKMLGHRFSNLGRGLYPAVGLRSVGESVAIDFNGPFMFDIASYVRSIRVAVWQQATIEQQVASIPRLVDQVPRILSEEDSNREEEKEVHEVVGNEEARRSDGTDVRPTTAGPPTPRNAMEKATAAFVLDYLQHHGHDKAFPVLRSGMQGRGWISLPTGTSKSEPTEDPAFVRKTPVGTLRLADFASPFAALSHLHALLAESYNQPTPWKLLKDLDPESLAITGPNQSLHHRLLIHNFLYLMQKSSLSRPSAEMTQGNVDSNCDLNDVDVEVEVEMDEKVIEEGKELLRQSKELTWSEEDVTVLQEAFGLLGDPKSIGDDVWRERREELARGVVSAIRVARGMKAVSHLEQALGQTSIVLRTLREREATSGAAFVDLKRIVK
ncbi:hypothetical protein IAR55_006393 [Kwoniella newhampshirensis]|uniref:B30.2/SPRY domain-containing protein n=1 Tax=Kwoniella newhampshirensis TaxID=1651941 RepID=A0AAW0YTU0_9TREE